MLFWISIIITSIYVLASVSALYVNRGLKLQGFTGISTLQCFNPVKWFSVFIGYAFKYLIPLHIFEQYVLRFYDPECRPDCISKGKCKICGCDSVCKAWSPIESCSKGNWPPVIYDKEEYQNFREEFPVKIKIEYGNGII